MPHPDIPKTKRVERWLRRTLLRAASVLSGTSTRSFQSFPDNPKLLLIRTDRIGDAIVSTPIVTLLRNRFPGSKIDMLFGMKNCSSAPLIPDLNAAYCLPNRPQKALQVLSELRSKRYDICINLTVKPSTTAILATLLSGSRFQIGFRSDEFSSYSHPIIPPYLPRHIVQTTSLLLQPFGIHSIRRNPLTPSEKLHITIPPSPNQSTPPRIIINISGSSFADSFWGKENILTAVRLLKKQGYVVALAGSPRDRGLLKVLAEQSIAELLHTTGSLLEFAQGLNTADLIITPDTSVAHISAALGKSTVVLSKGGDIAQQWYPWGVPQAVIVNEKGIPHITPDEVMVSVAKLLELTK